MNEKASREPAARREPAAGPEHPLALRNMWTDEILALDGVDMVCFGPNDLSVALTGRLDIHAAEVKEAMTLVLRKCREMSVMGLIFANDVDYAKPLVAEGWNVVAVGTDADWFSKAAADMKREARGA